MKPWSDDSVFQTVRFCNVNREDDRVTRWIRTNWTYPITHIDPNKGEDTSHFYDVSMIVARIFNLPSTLDKIHQPVGEEYERDYWLEHVEETLTDLRDNDERIWSGAYIISTNGEKIDKISYCMRMIRTISENPSITKTAKTLSEAHKALSCINGLGSFLSAQVVADLKNTNGHPLAYAPDWKTFSAPGPGSLRGLSWFFERRSLRIHTWTQSTRR